MVSKILAPLDCTEIAEAGLRWAEQAAQRSGAAVHLLTVVDPSEPDVEKRAKDAEAYLQSRRDHLKSNGLTVKMEVAVGEPAETILERAENVDLTVVSSGTVRWLISAVLDRVLERMTRPLVVVRASQNDPQVPATDRILVALDQVDYSSDIIPIVQDLAKSLSASVTLCHVVAPNVDEFGRAVPGLAGRTADPIGQAELFVSQDRGGVRERRDQDRDGHRDRGRARADRAHRATRRRRPDRAHDARPRPSGQPPGRRDGERNSPLYAAAVPPDPQSARWRPREWRPLRLRLELTDRSRRLAV